jgi:hypothetical protein
VHNAYVSVNTGASAVPKISFSDGLAIAGIAIAIFLLVLDKADKLRGPTLFILLAVTALMILPVALGNSWVQDAPTRGLAFGRGMLIVLLECVAYSGITIWMLTPNGMGFFEKKPLPSMGFSVLGSSTDYPSGTVIGGIPWNSKYCDLRVTIYPHAQDFDDLDIMLRPDEPIAGIGQISNIPDVSFLINTTVNIPAFGLINPSTGWTQAYATTELAFSGGFRFRCPKLPRNSSFQIVMAIARPTGAIGLAINASDGTTYWARTELDNVKSIEDYFGPKRLPKSLQIEGDYTVAGTRQHISMHLDVIDIGDAERKLTGSK